MKYFAICFAIIVWGLSYLFTQVALVTLTPMSLSFVRFLIAAIIMSPISINAIIKHKIKRKDLPRLIIGGILSVFVYYTAENYGVSLLPPVIISIMIATIPIFATLSESIRAKTRPTKKSVISVFISFIGVVLLLDVSSNELSSNLVGILLLFVCIISWVAFNQISLPLFDKYDYKTVTSCQIGFGVVPLIPFFLKDFKSIEWTLDIKFTISILFLSVFCSALAYFAYMYALSKLSIAKTTIFINLIPLVTYTMSFFFEHYRLNTIQFVGVFFIVASLFIINKKEKKRQIILE